MLRSISVLLCCCMLASQAIAKPVVFTQSFAGPQYGGYHIAVLQAALRVTEQDYGEASLTHHAFPMTQSRQILTLIRGEADVMWSVTTDQIEQQLLPVRFPLLQGLGGHRVFVINKAMQREFPHNQTLDNIKQMSSVQGGDWPDTRILQFHHFAVHPVTWSDWYTTMYRSLEKGMVDYFPRNVVEVYRDLDYHRSEQLTIEKNHLLIYPSYEYFFVAPHAPDLQKRLKEGLYRLLKSGELQRIFDSYPAHIKAKTMINDPERVKHYLNSNVLSYTLENADWTAHPRALLHELDALEVQPL